MARAYMTGLIILTGTLACGLPFEQAIGMSLAGLALVGFLSVPL